LANGAQPGESCIGYQGLSARWDAGSSIAPMAHDYGSRRKRPPTEAASPTFPSMLLNLLYRSGTKDRVGHFADRTWDLIVGRRPGEVPDLNIAAGPLRLESCLAE
jgi:hypothetical protein